MKTVCRISLLGLAMLAGCTTVPVEDIEVAVKADPMAHFGGYHSYTWLGAMGTLYDSDEKWVPPAFDAGTEIKRLIDRELCKRGLSQTNAGADVVVAFTAALDMDALDVQVNPESNLKISETIPQAGLIVTLTDSQTGYLIWIGAADAKAKAHPDTKIAKARLDYAVTQIFKKLPK